jgi:hypothetical protein
MVTEIRHGDEVASITRTGDRTDEPSNLEGRHRSMVLVDVEKFGDPKRTNTNQLQIRQGMYDALKTAFGGAQIPWEHCDVGDRGDGAMILVPADVSKNRLATQLPELLVAAIEEHNANCQPHARIRLRMALHAGEVHDDEHGQTSDSLNFAFRLLESPQARKALEYSAATLMIIISDWFYQNVVRHDPAAVPAAYSPVRFVNKETSALAWIRRLGDPAGEAVAASNGHFLSHMDVVEDPLTQVLRAKETDASGRQPALTTLVDRLLAIPTVAQEASRRLLMDHLRSDMANAVPYFAQSRHHVFSLVRTCMNYPGGVEELLSAVRLLEGESAPVLRLDATIAELLAQQSD